MPAYPSERDAAADTTKVDTYHDEIRSRVYGLYRRNMASGFGVGTTSSDSLLQILLAVFFTPHDF